MEAHSFMIMGRKILAFTTRSVAVVERSSSPTVPVIANPYEPRGVAPVVVMNSVACVPDTISGGAKIEKVPVGMPPTLNATGKTKPGVADVSSIREEAISLCNIVYSDGVTPRLKSAGRMLSVSTIVSLRPLPAPLTVNV